VPIQGSYNLRELTMKHLIALTLAAAAAAPAWATKPCDELKAELTTKIESHGAKNFTLEIVAPDQTGDKRVVGSCEGGSKKIVYSRKAADKKPA
jgi:hypothetical protein